LPFFLFFSSVFYFFSQAKKKVLGQARASAQAGRAIKPPLIIWDMGGHIGEKTKLFSKFIVIELNWIVYLLNWIESNWTVKMIRFYCSELNYN
jgi:mevalonate pyrophosphate decarboxylase